MKDFHAYPIKFLLLTICEHPELLTSQQLLDAGLSARRILDHAIYKTPRDDGLVQSGIILVCRTFQSDPVASETMLRRLLTPEHLQQFGYKDMPTLACELNRLFETNPAFARDVYKVAFGFKEERGDKTDFGSSRILAMTSTRRQDYELALWQFGEHYPLFIKMASVYAVETLATVLTDYIATKSYRFRKDREGVVFHFRGCEAVILTDMSSSWDAQMSYRFEPELKMLDALEDELSNLASKPESPQCCESIIMTVAKVNQWAALWRRVIICGAKQPKTLGIFVKELLHSTPILTCLDTSNVAGDFIKVIYPELDVNERELIERQIISIAGTIDQENDGWLRACRDRLLGCIPQTLIATQEAKRAIEILKEFGGPPANVPPFRFETITRAYDEQEHLVRQGVLPDNKANKILVELTQPIQQFITDFGQNIPTIEQVQKIIEPANQLIQALASAENNGAHIAQVESSLNHLNALCLRVAECRELPASSEAFSVVKGVLINAAHNTNPLPDAEQNKRFDDIPSWNSPAPRVEAAKGLLFLAGNLATPDPEIFQIIRTLNTDPTPQVRLQIATLIGNVFKHNRDFYFEIVSQMSTDDPSSSVLQSLINTQLCWVFWEDSAKVSSITQLIKNRQDLSGNNAFEVRMSCVCVFLNLYLWFDDSFSNAYIEEIATNSVKYTDEVTHIVQYIRELLSSGSVENPDPKVERARKRAFAILLSILKSVQHEFNQMQEKNKGLPFNNWPTETHQKANALAQIPNNIASQLYFASKAFEQKQNSTNANSATLSPSQKQRFLEESASLFDLFAINAHPSTVHHVIETLEYLLDVNPRLVLLRIAQILKAAKGGGYQYESLAITPVVGIVNQMLANYRYVLCDSQECRMALLEIVDIFVDAGRTEAIQLTYKINDIFN
jgi:hypothetical protein